MLTRYTARLTRGLWLCLSAAPVHAIASAFTQPGGGAYAELSVYNYASDAFYDSSRKKRTDNRYEKQELGFYYEYGLSPRLTYGMEFYYSHARAFRLGRPFEEESGLRGGGIFFRSALRKGPFRFSAVQAGARVSGGYSEDETRFFGEKEYTLSLFYQRAFQFRPRKMHLAWGPEEISVRRYFEIDAGTEQDIKTGQSRALFILTDEWQWPGYFLRQQSFEKHALNHYATSGAPLGTDSDALTLSLTFGKEFAPDLYGYIGWRKDIWGRNTTAGSGFLLGVTRYFAPPEHMGVKQ